MKKPFLYTCLLLITSISLKAQTAAKSAYIEVGGPGGVASLNFDRRFTKTNNGFGGRIGIGIFPDINVFSDRDHSAVTIPVEVNYLFGKNEGHHFLELGAGTTFISGSDILWTNKDDARFSSFVEHVTIGYRLQSKRGFFFHAIVCPVFSDGSAFWGGLGFGQRL